MINLGVGNYYQLYSLLANLLKLSIAYGGARSSAMRNDTSPSPSRSILNMDQGHHLSTGGQEQVVLTDSMHVLALRRMSVEARLRAKAYFSHVITCPPLNQESLASYRLKLQAEC